MRTVWGDLYIRLGYGGILVGVAAFGMVAGLVRRRLVAGPSLLNALLLALGVFTLMDFENDVLTTLAGLPRDGQFLVVALYWYAGGFNRGVATSSGQS